MRNRVFHRVMISGMTFEGVISGDGPYLSCSTDGGVAIGPAGLRYFRPEPWSRRRIAPLGWWVVKYQQEARIHLPDFDIAEIRCLSNEFGLPVLAEGGFDPFDDERQAYVFTSPAWEALRDWVDRHPRLAKATAACDAYLPGWYDRAMSELQVVSRWRWSTGTRGAAYGGDAGTALGCHEDRHQDADAAPPRKDSMAIMAAMADHMPAFHGLLDALSPDDMNQLGRRFPGFHRYAQILESFASGMQSGAIPVPGRTEAKRAATSDHARRAAAIDLRMRQLAKEGVPRSALLERMTAHVADFGAIWNTTSDEELAALCHTYPGFHDYAMLMEAGAEVERKKSARPYDDLPVLPDALKQQLSALLGEAAALERDYHSVFDAAGASAPASWLQPLGQRHARWQADLAGFKAAFQSADLPQRARDMVLPALDRMAQRIGELEGRGEAS